MTVITLGSHSVNRTGKARVGPAPERLPDAELEVLACLWNGKDATAGEIRESLARFRPMAHGSVLTLLKRLGEKGLVTRRKSGKGKAYSYRATRRPGPTYRRILANLTDRVFNGNPVTLVAALLESRTPSPEELDQIRQLLDDLQQPERRKGGSQ